jgi:hypothetical protein
MSLKADKQLERMKFLMEFKNSNSKTNSGIEYHQIAADGCAYGIIKEGDTYYIKKTTAENELIKESYDYLKGYNYRNEFGYKSYDKATKHFELHMMAINEKYNRHEDVSVVDFKKGEKDMSFLTEQARIEINRVNQIMENSMKIGMNNTGDPESKGKATDPTKQGEPFEEETKATLDKDLKTTATPKTATPDNTEVKGVDADLTSDKMKKCDCKGQCTCKDGECAHHDLEGESVADKKPKGGKCVKMNESVMEDEVEVDLSQTEDGDMDALDLSGIEFDDTVTPEDTTDELVGFGNEDGYSADEELENLMNEFLDMNGDVNASVGLIPEEETTPEQTTTQDTTPIEEEDKTVGPDEVLDGPHGDLKPMAWSKEQLQEKIEKMTNLVLEELCGKKKCDLAQPKKSDNVAHLEETITKMVNEELHKLNDWGKHPKYRKPAFTTPENTEVIVNKGDKDWDDVSAKGSEPYGKKIGSSAPFDKVVDMLTDAVVQQLKESKVLKKK